MGKGRGVDSSTDRALFLPESAGRVPSLTGARPGLEGARLEHSAETLRLYAGDWRSFAQFCAESGRASLPAAPEVVADFLNRVSGGRAVLARRLAAIDHRHRQHGLPTPGNDRSVRLALRRARAVAPRRKQPVAITRADLLRRAERCPRDLVGVRDRAVLLLLAAGLSRRQVVGLQAELLRFGEDEVRLAITDGSVLVPRDLRHDLCPVRALEAWLRASATRYGPVFRKITRWGTVEPQALGADAVRLILARRRA